MHFYWWIRLKIGVFDKKKSTKPLPSTAPTRDDTAFVKIIKNSPKNHQKSSKKSEKYRKIIKNIILRPPDMLYDVFWGSSEWILSKFHQNRSKIGRVRAFLSPSGVDVSSAYGKCRGALNCLKIRIFENRKSWKSSKSTPDDSKWF